MKKIAIIGIGNEVLRKTIKYLAKHDINTDPIPTSLPGPFDTTPSYLIIKMPDVPMIDIDLLKEPSPIFQPKKHTKSNYASHKRKKRR
jgi:hypothetical protein